MSPYREIVLPDLGAGAHPIRVVQWLVDRDSEVLAGDRLLEVAATGVLFVVNAAYGGVLRSQQVVSDALVMPGDVLGVMEVEGTEVDDEDR